MESQAASLGPCCKLLQLSEERARRWKILFSLSYYMSAFQMNKYLKKEFKYIANFYHESIKNVFNY